jgi:DNA-binding Lrp family transcriptional regulator
MTIKELSTHLNLTSTPIFERIRRLEREGVITGYGARVDADKMGYPLIAYCYVELERHHTEFIEQFIRDIQKLPEVRECYHIAGMFDYLLKIYSRDMSDYQMFIAKKLASVPNIGKVHSSFVLKEIKTDHPL